jgi:hypothetical protein
MKKRCNNGADGGGRTHTSSRILDFESSASANSATSAANKVNGLLHYQRNMPWESENFRKILKARQNKASPPARPCLPGCRHNPLNLHHCNRENRWQFMMSLRAGLSSGRGLGKPYALGSIAGFQNSRQSYRQTAAMNLLSVVYRQKRRHGHHWPGSLNATTAVSNGLFTRMVNLDSVHRFGGKPEDTLQGKSGYLERIWIWPGEDWPGQVFSTPRIGNGAGYSSLRRRQCSQRCGTLRVNRGTNHACLCQPAAFSMTRT